MTERGMALLTGLLLLAAISVLAVTAASGMNLQRQQAGHFEDRILALSAAELAETHALSWLYSRDRTAREPGCIEHCLLPDAVYRPGALPERPEHEDEEWWRQYGTAAGVDPVSGSAAGYGSVYPTRAYWTIQELHFEATGAPIEETKPEGIGYYRILGRGSARQAGSVAVTETIVARPWGEHVAPLEFPSTEPLSAFCDGVDEAVSCGTLAWRRRR